MYIARRLTLVFLGGFICFAQAAPTEHADEVRAAVEQRFGRNGPGVAVAVCRDHQLVYAEGFGLADLKTGRPVTPRSLFDLASVSKHITGVALLKLVEAGKVKLDRPVADYLSSWHVPVKDRPVTVKDLLHHVSGLADYTGDDWEGSDEEFAALTPATHLKWLNSTKPHRAPGVRYVYNNSEYVVLAAIVEGVSGRSFASFVGEQLFKPAGMKSSFVLDKAGALTRDAVTGYARSEDGKVKPSSLPTIITGDGNVYSSVADLGRWFAALDSGRIIPSQLASLAYENGSYDSGKPIDDSDGNGYGFGWVIEEGGKRVWHAGEWYGASSYIIRDFSSRVDVIVLSNDENAEVGELGDEILEMFAD